MVRALRIMAAAAATILAGLPAPVAASDPPPPTPAADDDPTLVVPTPQCKRQPAQARYRITLRPQAELSELVDWMMSVSCQKFIWDPAVRAGKVNIVSPEPVSLSEAYAAFYAALGTMGLTVEPSGAYFKIVEIAGKGGPGGAGRDLPIYGPATPVPADDRLATKIVRPAPGRRDDVLALLRALTTSHGTVETVGDAIVVTDTGHRIGRLMELVGELDAPPESRRRVFLYEIRNTDPTTLAEVVRSVFGGPATARPTAAAGSRPKGDRSRGSQADAAVVPAIPDDLETPVAVVVDEPSSTLIVVGTPDQYAPVRKLIDALDVGDPRGQGTLHVLELRHADAAEIKEVLTGVAPGDAPGGGRSAPAASELGAAVGGDIEVMAHASSQTLVVRATEADFAAVTNVVRALDKPQRQLYIELYLLEVRAEDFREVGVGGHSTQARSDGSLGVISSAPGGTTALDLATSEGASSLLGGLTAAFIGPAIPGYEIPAFGVILQALETRKDVNVIARPHMYAAENQEATVEFGDVIPMNGGTTTLPGTVGGTSVNINREPVGMTIKVLPKVNDDETVTMDVTLEDNQLGPAEAGLNAYRTSQRRLDLKQVIAHPGQPVVLGGLVKESDKITESRVPGLGRVPVLGWLFKNRRRDKEKVTLLMVMVPHIIDTPDDARRIHTLRLQERMDFIAQYTAFARKDLDTHINYRKKSGLLATVNASARRQADEAGRLDAAREELDRPRTDASIALGGGD